MDEVRVDENEIKRISQRTFIESILVEKSEECRKLFTERFNYVQAKARVEFLSNESIVIILMLVENTLERENKDDNIKES